MCVLVRVLLLTIFLTTHLQGAHLAVHIVFKAVEHLLSFGAEKVDEKIAEARERKKTAQDIFVDELLDQPFCKLLFSLPEDDCKAFIARLIRVEYVGQEGKQLIIIDSLAVLYNGMPPHISSDQEVYKTLRDVRPHSLENATLIVNMCKYYRSKRDRHLANAKYDVCIPGSGNPQLEKHAAQQEADRLALLEVGLHHLTERYRHIDILMSIYERIFGLGISSNSSALRFSEKDVPIALCNVLLTREVQMARIVTDCKKYLQTHSVLNILLNTDGTQNDTLQAYAKEMDAMLNEHVDALPKKVVIEHRVSVSANDLRGIYVQLVKRIKDLELCVLFYTAEQRNETAWKHMGCINQELTTWGQQSGPANAVKALLDTYKRMLAYVRVLCPQLGKE